MELEVFYAQGNFTVFICPETIWPSVCFGFNCGWGEFFFKFQVLGLGIFLDSQLQLDSQTDVMAMGSFVSFWLKCQLLPIWVEGLVALIQSLICMRPLNYIICW